MSDDAKQRYSLAHCPFCGSLDIDAEGWMSCNEDGSGKKTGPACNECGGSAGSIAEWNTRFDKPSCNGEQRKPDGLG